jgi:D-arginine dehydrogenase
VSAPDVVVVGGGIAGLSAAACLASAGLGKVRLLEREPALFAHASGKNAAIFRTAHEDEALVALAVRSRALLEGWDRAVVKRTGVLLASQRPSALDPLAHRAHQHGAAYLWIRGRALFECAPDLEGGELRHGLLFPDDGVIDVHRLCGLLTERLREAGGEVSLGEEARALWLHRGRVVGVTTARGERISAGAVVASPGAWTAALGLAWGTPLPVRPLRRHLALLSEPPRPKARCPVVWRVDQECYLRSESGGTLASPCDEMPWPPGNPPTHPGALERLALRVGRTAPGLAGAQVRRAWACLRAFAPDRRPVIGADPRLRGLYWLAGLGGHGMTGGVAAAEVLRCAVLGQPHPLRELLGPRRLVRGAKQKRRALEVG